MYRTILGAIIGLCIGLLLKAPWAIFVFVLVGTFIGSRFDFAAPTPKALEDDADLPPPEDDVRKLERVAQAARKKKLFTEDVCGLFVALGQADGELVREEVRVAKQFFVDDLAYEQDELEGVRLAMKAAMASPPSLEDAAHRCVQTMTETERVLLINALFEVALADGPLSPDEQRVISEAADALKVPPEDLRTVFEMHLGTGEQHYRALGVTSDISDAELKAAYKRLVVLHHPDRVAHQGSPAQERAAERFHEIQSAWEQVRRLRNL